MTKILKGSTCQPKEIHKAHPTERLQQFRTREFWSKPPLERSRIAAEWLKKRMGIHHVSVEQVAMYTRMDLNRLQAILDGNVVMGLSEFSDIFHATRDADESLISPDYLYHHRPYGSLKKITWLLSWEEIHVIDENQDIRMPFTKENFIEFMEQYNIKE